MGGGAVIHCSRYPVFSIPGEHWLLFLEIKFHFLKAPLGQTLWKRYFPLAKARECQVDATRKKWDFSGQLINSAGGKKQNKAEAKGKERVSKTQQRVKEEIVDGCFCYSCSVKEKMQTFILSSHTEWQLGCLKGTKLFYITGLLKQGVQWLWVNCIRFTKAGPVSQWGGKKDNNKYTKQKVTDALEKLVQTNK